MNFMKTPSAGEIGTPTQLAIENLFGEENRTVTLNEAIGIVYGKNGCGKTTILKIINAILSGSFNELRNIRFKKITAKFSLGHELWISKVPDQKCSENNLFDSKNLLLKLTRNGTILEQSELEDDDIEPGFPLSMIENEIPELDRASTKEWEHLITGEILTLRDVIDRYSDRFSWLGRSSNKKWYRHLGEKWKVKFIQTQRLLTLQNQSERHGRGRTPRYEDTVTTYASKLRSMIRDIMSTSVAISQKLDSSYPSRLLDNRTSKDFNTSDIIGSISQIKEQTRTLEAIGLLAHQNMIQIDDASIKEENKKALALYLQDTANKLSIFGDISKRITLFSEILNRKFNKKKTISISIDDGFIIKSRNGEHIPSRLLSSGEQHEIVLLFDLIFQSDENTFVLIDEPEISLHIDWQRTFVEDLEAIGEISNLRFLIATHSPAIIGNRMTICQEIA